MTGQTTLPGAEEAQAGQLLTLLLANVCTMWLDVLCTCPVLPLPCLSRPSLSSLHATRSVTPLLHKLHGVIPRNRSAKLKARVDQFWKSWDDLWCFGRVVKASHSKCDGLCPRRFKSCRHRLSFCIATTDTNGGGQNSLSVYFLQELTPRLYAVRCLYLRHLIIVPHQ